MTSRGAISTVAVMGERLGIASRILRWWRSLPMLVVDGALAVVVLAVSLIEVGANNRSDEIGPWQMAVLVAMSLVIVLRRRYPVAVWLVSGALVTVYGVGQFPDPTLPYGPLIAVYTVAARTSARTAAWAGLITLAAVAAGLIIDPHDDAVDWLVAMLSVTTAWLIGNNMRTQRAYASELEARAADVERERQVEAQRAVDEERLRLARELHDVAAHHVSVIALHAEAGQSQLPGDTAGADRSFQIIGDVARTTLSELRRVVGVLRDEGEAPLVPQRGLGQLPALVHEVEQAGVPVTLRVTGSLRPIGEAVDASAYRIVQEALTNVLRHAGPAEAEVNVTYLDDAVSVEVLDNGTGPNGSPGTGHGLIGMRERAAAFGGSMSATARPGGGFAVTARLPT
jgi:signal transduction histidine kinase